jgi:hypothetical protein
VYQLYGTKTKTNYESWVNNARNHGEDYSKMYYNTYKSDVFGEVIKATRSTAQLGCFGSLAFLGLSGIYGFFVGLNQLIQHERDDYTFILGIAFFIFFGIPGVLALIGWFKER